jgi:hypothetical protein
MKRKGQGRKIYQLVRTDYQGVTIKTGLLTIKQATQGKLMFDKYVGQPFGYASVEIITVK